jgi:hypothetical protein
MSVVHFGAPEASAQTDELGEGLKRARLDGDERTVHVAIQHQLFLTEKIMEVTLERDSLSVALALEFSSRRVYAGTSVEEKKIVIVFKNGMKCRIETQTEMPPIPEANYGIHFLLSTVTRQNSTAAVQERIAPSARTDTPGRGGKDNQGIFLRFEKYFASPSGNGLDEPFEVLPALVSGCRLILDMFYATGINFAGTEGLFPLSSTSTAELDIEMLRLLGGDVLPGEPQPA